MDFKELFNGDSVILPWLSDNEYNLFIKLSPIEKLKILEVIMSDFSECFAEGSSEQNITKEFFQKLNDYINNYQTIKNLETL